MKENEVKYRRYSDYADDVVPDFIHMKIIVKTEEEKLEILKTSKYIHDFMIGGYEKRFGKFRWNGLDSDIMGVNWLMHIYSTPECVEVRPDEKFYGFDE